MSLRNIFCDFLVANGQKKLDVTVHNAIVKEAKRQNIKLVSESPLFIELQRSMYLEIMKVITSANSDEIKLLQKKIQKMEYPWGVQFDDWKKEIEHERIPQQIQVEEGIFECKKCKSKKVISTQVQTRSADEGSTNIMRCSECAFTWKEFN